MSDHEWTPLATSPICPWCGDEVTDDNEDLAAICARHEIPMDCGGCGKPVVCRLEPPVSFKFQARKRDTT